ncbi:hypothetical protein AYO21_00832 [Fonsecaea monophora]|uniref:Uncharacterized protein n=1 Tax=Fonsecaea monophora TaxID=254056 RepID=A0A177FMS7_9EURO|nr:hypothetical protein AYO21_00832 [Fonsecaea monophora]KAH0844363.1 hypothetical protein FOPE_09426 [Fonsecaea pedrosoi]OAG44870.1 hypothetical protein AYO21_00832 [Fonsecaea monophora]
MAEESPLFLHYSPVPNLTRSPDDEVPGLVERAQSVDGLGPAFDNFLLSYEHAFFDLFDRQVELIKSRSQAFEDGHVTVFDKSLLILTQNGQHLNNPAAIKYYCKEYLNIDLDTRDATHALTPRLQQTVQLTEALQQELSRGRTSTFEKGPGNKPARLSPVDPHLRNDMEPKLAVLWSVYETARAEYEAFVDKDEKDDIDTAVKRAKFLRDTAENILLYLKNKNADPSMIAELESTFNHAKNTAVCLTGGKKRKFDPAGMDKIKGTPRGPSLPSRKEKQRGSGGTDGGNYKQQQHQYQYQLPHHPYPDISSGHAGENTSSYGWVSSDLPSGHGYSHQAIHPDTFTYYDQDPHHLTYAGGGGSGGATATSRDHRHSYGHGYDQGEEDEYTSAAAPYNAAVSSSHHRHPQERVESVSRTGPAPLFNEPASPMSIDPRDIRDHERGGRSPSPRSPSFKRERERDHDRHSRHSRHSRRSRRHRDREHHHHYHCRDQHHRHRRDRSRRRSRSPVIDRAYDQAYSQARRHERELELEREWDHDDNRNVDARVDDWAREMTRTRTRADAGAGAGGSSRPTVPMVDHRENSPFFYGGYGGHTGYGMLDSYVPSRDRSRSRSHDRGRRGS